MFSRGSEKRTQYQRFDFRLITPNQFLRFDIFPLPLPLSPRGWTQFYRKLQTEQIPMTRQAKLRTYAFDQISKLRQSRCCIRNERHIMEEIRHCHSSDTFSGVQLTFPIPSEESGQRDRRIDKYILSTLLLRAPLDLTKLDITRL